MVVLLEEEMFLVFAIPMFLFLCGLGILTWTETKSLRRDETAVDPMFSRKAADRGHPTRRSALMLAGVAYYFALGLPRQRCNRVAVSPDKA